MWISSTSSNPISSNEISKTFNFTLTVGIVPPTPDISNPDNTYEIETYHIRSLYQVDVIYRKSLNLSIFDRKKLEFQIEYENLRKASDFGGIVNPSILPQNPDDLPKFVRPQSDFFTTPFIGGRNMKPRQGYNFDISSAPSSYPPPSHFRGKGVGRKPGWNDEERPGWD